MDRPFERPRWLRPTTGRHFSPVQTTARDLRKDTTLSKLLAAKDLRPIMQAMYPDVEDGREDNENYEHPMTAVGLVLLSAAIIGTTEAAKLTLFTGYCRSFISAITLNMRNNLLMDRRRI